MSRTGRYNLNYNCPNASIQKHGIMERYNFQLYEQLLKKGDLRWATIVLFYFALHKIQKLIIQNSPSTYPNSHYSRRSALDQVLSSGYPNLLTNYMNLEARSCEARYCPEISLEWKNEPYKSMIISFLNQTENYFVNL